MCLAASLATTGCADMDLPQVVVRFGAGDPGPLALRPALVAADEPQAALIGARILKTGGTAADAAAAMAFALAVTLPSSAGLDARGACLIHDGASGATLVLDFIQAAVDADQPPLAQAMSALQGRFGVLPWGTVLAPAANLARFGATVSQILAERLKDGASLLNDRAALAAFTSDGRQLVAAGATFKQPSLADAIDRARTGVRTGSAALWQAAETRVVDGVHVTPPRVLGDGTSSDTSVGASTGFVVADSKGGAVACTLTMGRAFGRGVMGPGYLLAAEGRSGLASVIMTDAQNRIVMAAAASGRTAGARIAALVRSKGAPVDTAEGGDTLVNVAVCSGDADRPRCDARADRRGLGYAVVGETGVQ